MAADYGGDLDQPVTFVGWSLGATAALGIGLTDNIDPTGEQRARPVLPLRPSVAPTPSRGETAEQRPATNPAE